MFDINKIRVWEREIYQLYYPSEIDNIRESFFTSTKYTGDDAFFYAFGGCVCAPLYVGFCEWAIKEAERENVSVIFPIMREGAFYAKILNMIMSQRQKKIAITPIYVSRKSSCIAMCYNQFDFSFFVEMCKGHPKTIAGCFEKLGIEEYKYIYENNEDKLNQAIREGDEEPLRVVYTEIVKWRLDKNINAKIRNTKELLGEYIAQHGGKEDFLTLDLGSMGTIPQAIDNCTSSQIKKIHLFLTACYPVAERKGRGHDIRYIVDNFSNATEKLDVMFTNTFNYFYETITMGNLQVGTATGYYRDVDEVIRVQCLQSTYNHDTRVAVGLIQEGVLRFCEQYNNMQLGCGESLENIDLINLGMGTFCRFIEHPLVVEAENMGRLEYDNNNLREPRRMINSLVMKSDRLTFSELPSGEFLIESPLASMWPQGVQTLISNKRREQDIAYKVRRVVVYGLGRWGRHTIDYLQYFDVQIVCIVDRAKAGQMYFSYPVISINELCDYEFEDAIIATVDYKYEIERLLMRFSNEYQRDFSIHHIKVEKG